MCDHNMGSRLRANDDETYVDNIVSCFAAKVLAQGMASDLTSILQPEQVAHLPEETIPRPPQILEPEFA